MIRTAEIKRDTKETQITARLCLDGTGKSRLHTGIRFFDHMLDGFARHGLFDLEVDCQGDLEVDCHHSIEDTGIVLGSAIKQAAGEKKAFAVMDPLSFQWMRRLYSARWICPAGRILYTTPLFAGNAAGRWTHRWRESSSMPSAMRQG